MEYSDVIKRILFNSILSRIIKIPLLEYVF